MPRLLLFLLLGLADFRGLLLLRGDFDFDLLGDRLFLDPDFLVPPLPFFGDCERLFPLPLFPGDFGLGGAGAEGLGCGKWQLFPLLQLPFM